MQTVETTTVSPHSSNALLVVVRLIMIKFRSYIQFNGVFFWVILEAKNIEDAECLIINRYSNVQILNIVQH